MWDFRWRTEWFQWELELVEKFNKMERVSLKRGVEDTWWWEGEPNDGYSVKSTYSYLHDMKYDS